MFVAKATLSLHPLQKITNYSFTASGHLPFLSSETRSLFELFRLEINSKLSNLSKIKVTTSMTLPLLVSSNRAQAVTA